MELNSSLAMSPSFNSYSNASLSRIAQRVVEEFEDDDDAYEAAAEEEEFHFSSEQSDHVDDEQEREFEFHFQVVEAEKLLKTADEIFQDGLIRPVYSFPGPYIEPGRNIRVSLRKLFTEERDNQTTTTSTSDDVGLDGVPPESYCVWRPGKADAARVCKKSGSTGSVSKKWKLRDILVNYRSRSDGGKVSLVFPSDGTAKRYSI